MIPFCFDSNAEVNYKIGRKKYDLEKILRFGNICTTCTSTLVIGKECNICPVQVIPDSDKTVDTSFHDREMR